MAGSNAYAGHNTFVHYLWEDNGFASSPNDSTYKTFGADVQLTTNEGSNALRRVFMPGSPQAIDQLAMIFDGAWAVEFTVTGEDPWWIRMLIGAPSTSGSGPYTHSYDTNSSDYPDPDSFRLIETYPKGNDERYFLGCVATRMTVDVNVEEEARVTLEGAYADEAPLTEDDSGNIQSSQTQPSGQKMTFGEAALRKGSGPTVQGYVQSMTLTLERNVDMIREMGSRFPIDFNPKVVAPEMSFDKIKNTNDELEELKDMYGDASEPQEDVDNTAYLDIQLDNGESGTDQDKVQLEIENSKVDAYGERGVGDPTADLIETLTRPGLEFKAEAINNTSTAQ